MELLTITAVITVTGALNAVCFFIGAKVGQKVSRGEKLEVPTVDLAGIADSRRKKKRVRAEEDRLETILSNLAAYNGTEVGQRDVPGR